MKYPYGATFLKVGIGTALAALGSLFLANNYFPYKNMTTTQKVNHDGSSLTEGQKKVLFEKGTEAPFTSELLKEKRSGTYVAADTGEALFRSEDKFDSGTGWPSFTKAITGEAVEERQDSAYGMTRTEVTTKGGSHLGHVFTDGPKEAGGLRYCINGAALKFVPDAPQDIK
jgi:methionine-R-sulfoxide reductase